LEDRIMSGSFTRPDELETGTDIRLRRFSPEDTRIFEGEHSTLCCELGDGSLHRGLSVVRLFPATSPERYISLTLSDADGVQREVGVIEDIADFPADAQRLLRLNLRRHYHERVVSRIYSARYRYELLFFDVQTQRGREELLMRWQYDRAQDYGPHGKALLDVNENRYIIQDVTALPLPDQRRFTRFIYW
jgi:hypothetical protein